MVFVGRVAPSFYGTTPGAVVTKFSYLPALDGWRAISILLVLIGHGGLGHIIPGGLGVTIFFFISGFLITSLLISEIQSTNKISLSKFYLRRFWRLSPPLLVYILISLCFIYHIKYGVSISEIAASIFYFANYYLLYWNYEPLSFGPSPLGVLWSLAIEEHYYLLFAPTMAFFANTWKRLSILLFILILCPLFIRIYAVYGISDTFTNDSYTYMATEARIDSIAWGAFLAWLLDRFNSKEIGKILDSKFAICVSITILILCLVVRDERFRESIRYSLQGFSLLVLFYSSLYGTSLNWPKSILTSSIFVKIGKLSYSIYLYHWLAMIISSWIFGTEKLALRWLISYYGLTLVLAVSSYRFIELPFLAIRKKYGSHVAT